MMMGMMGGKPPKGGSSSAVDDRPPPPPTGERKDLLSSISKFKKGGLKKAQTVDKSGPRLDLTKDEKKGGGGGRGMPPMY